MLTVTGIHDLISFHLALQFASLFYGLTLREVFQPKLTHLKPSPPHEPYEHKRGVRFIG